MYDNIRYDSHSHDRAYVQAIKDRFTLSSVVAEATPVTRRGSGFMARCPFHDDKAPSLSIDDEQGLFNCFGCGAGGDVIDFVQQLEGIGFQDACRKLLNGYVPAPSEQIVARSDGGDRSRTARNIWNAATAVEGTPAALYLESRGLPSEFIMTQENLRFARLSFDHSAKKHPALVAAVRNLSGEIVAIQRIYLTEEGAKMALDCKRSLGSITGAAIRLRGQKSTSDTPINLHVCEGLEDGLSLARIDEEAVVWVAMGSSNLANIDLPGECETVTIADDNDEAGERAVDLAKTAYVKRGKTVLTLMPPAAAKDWNAYLMHWEFDSDVFGNDLPWRHMTEDDFFDENNEWLLPTLHELESL